MVVVVWRWGVCCRATNEGEQAVGRNANKRGARFEKWRNATPLKRTVDSGVGATCAVFIHNDTSPTTACPQRATETAFAKSGIAVKLNGQCARVWCEVGRSSGETT